MIRDSWIVIRWLEVQARRIVRRLLDQCRPVARTFTADGELQPEGLWAVAPRLEADGALLARFLARKGVD